MAGLQRSEISFRRQGSSGLVWDDKFLRELDRTQREEDIKSQEQQQEEQQEQVKDANPVGSINTIERSRSNGGGRGFRTGKVSPAIEPPSPRLSVCGFCSAFGKTDKTRRRPKAGKRRT